MRLWIGQLEKTAPTPEQFLPPLDPKLAPSVPWLVQFFPILSNLSGASQAWAGWSARGIVVKLSKGKGAGLPTGGETLLPPCRIFGGEYSVRR